MANSIKKTKGSAVKDPTEVKRGGWLKTTLICAACAAAIAAVKQELGGKWAVGVALEQCAIAWICAAIVKVIAASFGLF